MSDDFDTSHQLRLLVLTPENDTVTALEDVRDRAREVLGTDDHGDAWAASLLFDDPAVEADLPGTSIVVSGFVARPIEDLATQKASFELSVALRAAGHYDEVEPDLPVGAFLGLPESSAFLDNPASQHPNWSRLKMRVPDAWTFSETEGHPPRGRGIVIGHPDTGYTLHAAVAGAYDLGRDHDFIDDDDDALDPLETGLPLTVFPGHGTGTSSVMAGRDVDGLVFHDHHPDAVLEFSGVAPEATVIPIRAVRSVIQFFDSDVAKAVTHANDRGVGVISMSLGGKGFFGLKRAIRHAVANGAIVMAAAGNYVMIVTAPASYDGCIAVGASNVDDQPWASSSHGDKVEICAPGEKVWTVGWNIEAHTQHVDRSDGTSHAVANLAGVAALWLAHHGRQTLVDRYGAGNIQAAFLEVLRGPGHSLPPNWDTAQYGVGIVDALGVLQAPLPALGSGAFATDLDADLEESPLDRIAASFPTLSPADVRTRLVSTLGVADGALDAVLDQHGAEINFHLLADRGLRAAFADTVADEGSAFLGDLQDGATARRLLARASGPLAAAVA